MMKPLFLFMLFSQSLFAMTRIKDVATLKGVRDNQLWGYGVVVGLQGSGDRDLQLTDNSLNMALKSLGVDVGDQKVRSRNAAAVIVSANLPAFSGVGSHLDIHVSSIGSATSLENGTLLLTALKGADGEVYAMAQGKVYNPKSDGQRFSRRDQTVSGFVPKGAILEKQVPLDINKLKSLTYQLHRPDFTTAARMANQINRELGVKVAVPVSPGAVEVNYPSGFRDSPVNLIARIESLAIETDQKARIVINRTTGTVVLGSQVKIAPVAISHNNLRLEIKEPEPLNRNVAGIQAEGTPLLDADAQARAPVDGLGAPASEEGARSRVHLLGGATVAEVVDSLNQLGASPQDLIAILHSLRRSGALNAEVEIN